MTVTGTISKAAAETATGTDPTRPPTRGQVPRLTSRAGRAAVRWLATYSLTGLRISLGLVIAGFGALKFFPGASPAEDLVMQTTQALTFGIVSGQLAVTTTAVIETVIGLALLTGWMLRPAMALMTGWLLGIMAPVVLFPGEMFPGGLPTLAAQYVLKDVILIAAAAVVGARAFGARLIAPADPSGM